MRLTLTYYRYYLDTSNFFSKYDVMTACEASAQLTTPAGMILVEKALHVCRITIIFGWINCIIPVLNNHYEKRVEYYFLHRSPRYIFNFGDNQ